MQSYVNKEGDWNDKKIKLKEISKTILSKLTPGYDLTRSALPACLLMPYSMLELLGFRELNSAEMLLHYDQEGSPGSRMLLVVKWFLSTIQDEKYTRKPYNPILGETHHAYVQTELGKIEFIAEQVIHHPPTSAMYFHCPSKGVKLWGVSDFTAKFSANSVHATTSGGSILKLNNETYELSRIVPDMWIKNIIIGKTRCEWIGEINIICRETGMSAAIVFEKENYLRGFVMDASKKIIISFAGKTGGLIELVIESNKVKNVMADFGTIKRSPIRYDMTPSDENESLEVWRKLTKCIVENDIDRAEQEKAEIERKQREAPKKQAKFFMQNNIGQWVPKNL